MLAVKRTIKSTLWKIEMFQNYLGIVYENLSEEWKKLILSPPSFLFWGITTLLVFVNKGWGWKQLDRYFNEISFSQGVLLVVGGSLLIVISSTIVEWFQIFFFRLLEGYYWDETIISLKLTGRIKEELENKEIEFYKNYEERQENQKNNRSSDANEVNKCKRLIEIDNYLDNYPIDKNNLLPTCLGNLLRAAEEYPTIRYGLEIFTVWPRLWMILPDSARNLHNSVLEDVYKSTRIIIWSIAATFLWGILLTLIFSNIYQNNLLSSTVLLFHLVLAGMIFLIGYLFFSYLSTDTNIILRILFIVIWGIVLSLIFSMFYDNLLIYSRLLPFLLTIFLMGYLFIRHILYVKLLDSASIYANLLRSTFDIYRFELYKNLHLKLPEKCDIEEKTGEKLSKYLKRGICTDDFEIASENEQKSS